MLISHQNKFIYVKAHKVAGTSVEMAFQKFCLPPATVLQEECDEIVSDKGIVGCRSGDSQKVKNSYWQNHLNTQQIKDKLKNDDIFYDYFKFGIIRNPFDRIKSIYEWFGYSKKILFKKYVETITFEPLYDFYYLDIHKIDYFIRFESLLDGIKHVCNHLNIDYNEINLGHYKNGNNKHYTEYYDEKTKKIVEQKYWKDIEYFKYQFVD